MGDLNEATRMKCLNTIVALVLLTCLCVVTAVGNPGAVRASTDVGTLPEIASFQVSPTTMDSGMAATLSWDVRNAVSASIDHGIGDVSASGQRDVRPAFSTTYKLTVSNDAGTRVRYVTLYVEMVQPATSDTVNCDPVTGRNSEVDLSWQSYCLSDQYQVQIARDPGFTLKMYDSGSMSTADSLYPAFRYPPGNLEAGHTYYWRVRTTRAATGQYILSQWSEARPFTVNPGYAVRADYVTVQAFMPANGCTACPVKPVSFSWSGYPNTTKYRFILAHDSQLQNIVVEGFTSTTSYALSSSLEYDTSYFWQVMAIEPVPSDPSSVFTFHTQPATASEAKQLPPAGLPSQAPPWAIAVIVSGTVLIIAAIVFSVRSRRRL
jgi:hypothetical protein